MFHYCSKRVCSSFSSGLRRALTLYSTNVNVKRTVDRLQMNFGCCGNEDYTDWFRVAWIQDVYMHPSDYGDSGMAEGGRLVDSVPFSCCSPHSVRPCVHQWVRDGGRHANYAWQQDLTLYRLGCRQALMDFFGSRVLVTTGAIILAVFFVQVLMTILTRYLQVTCMAAGITSQSDGTRRSSDSKRQSVSNKAKNGNGNEDSKSRKSISERRYSQPRESIRALPVAQASDEVVKVLDDDDYSWGSDFDEVDEDEEERTQLLRQDTRRNNNQHASPSARKYKRKSQRRQ